MPGRGGAEIARGRRVEEVVEEFLAGDLDGPVDEGGIRAGGGLKGSMELIGEGRPVFEGVEAVFEGVGFPRLLLVRRLARSYVGSLAVMVNGMGRIRRGSDLNGLEQEPCEGFIKYEALLPSPLLGNVSWQVEPSRGIVDAYYYRTNVFKILVAFVINSWCGLEGGDFSRAGRIFCL